MLDFPQVAARLWRKSQLLGIEKFSGVSGVVRGVGERQRVLQGCNLDERCDQWRHCNTSTPLTHARLLFWRRTPQFSHRNLFRQVIDQGEPKIEDLFLFLLLTPLMDSSFDFVFPFPRLKVGLTCHPCCGYLVKFSAELAPRNVARHSRMNFYFCSDLRVSEF